MDPELEQINEEIKRNRFSPTFKRLSLIDIKNKIKKRIWNEVCDEAEAFRWRMTKTIIDAYEKPDQEGNEYMKPIKKKIKQNELEGLFKEKCEKALQFKRGTIFVKE